MEKCVIIFERSDSASGYEEEVSPVYYENEEDLKRHIKIKYRSLPHKEGTYTCTVYKEQQRYKIQSEETTTLKPA